MNNRIFNLLVESDEISWKSMIFDLVKKEKLNPWNVDVSSLSERFIETLKEMKILNLKVSGKVVLAASILLRLKSSRLLGEDLDDFDRLIAGAEVDEEEFYDELSQELARGEVVPKEKFNFSLLPRLPQPRKRKVSVFELVNALEKALEVKQRRILRSVKPDVKIPEKTFNIGKAIFDLELRIKNLSSINDSVKFADLLRDGSKEDIVLTFLPLLHLSNQGVISLEQKSSFEDIFIFVGGNKNVE
jgi:segregation and condensation protein A